MKYLLAILLLSAAAFGQCPSYTASGEGPDIPQNIQIQGTCLGGGGGNPYGPVQINTWSGNNTVQITWQTNTPADCLANLDYNNNESYSAPTAQRQIYSPTLTTSCSLTLDHIMPGKTYLVLPAGCGPNGSGGIPPLRCSRDDPNFSVTGYGSSEQFHGFAFIAPPLNSAGGTVWQFWPSGAPYTYQGHPLNIDLVGVQASGQIPTWIHATQLQIDGQTCGASRTGGACGSTGMTILLDGNGAEVPNNGSNGFNVLVPTSGTYAGMYEVGGSTTDITANVFNQPGALLYVTTSGSTSVGSHTITGTFQATDSNQNALGSPVNISYTFQVLAPASFTVTPPTSFPAIQGLNKWDVSWATVGPAKYNGWINQNKNQGVYNNDNFSATQTAIDYWAVFNYSGERVAFQHADYAKSVVTPWQPSHAYTSGDKFCSAGAAGCASASSCVLVVTTGGTSGSSQPACPAVGGTVQDGGAVETNAGNSVYWNQQAQRVLMQTMPWEIEVSRYNAWQEWNLFALGTEMDYFREGGALSENCNGSGSCTGIQKKALQYLASPLINTPGISSQGCKWEYKFIDAGTIRTMPYCLELLAANWLVNGSPVVNSGIDEGQVRVELLLQTLAQLDNYSPPEIPTNVYPCCLSTPSFDLGLAYEALIQYYTVQSYMGATPDARIPIEIMKSADWFYSTRFNPSGSDYTTPYTFWVYPGGPQTYNYPANAQLNNLIAPALAWLFEANGNNCTLPTSGVSCTAAADLIAEQTMNVGFGTAKQYNQAFKWWQDYYLWRNGGMTANQTYILPTFNQNNGTLPDTFEPYNANEFPINYPAYTATSNTATVNWYTYEGTVSTKLMLGAESGGQCPSSYPLVFTGGPASFQGNDIEWLNSVQATGLNPSTIYCYKIGATDAAGNTSLSGVSGLTGASYTLTTQAGGPPPFTFNPPPLPAGTQNVFYQQQIGGTSGGVQPYHFTETGTLPTDITLSSTGLLSGTTSQTGQFPFTAVACDSENPQICIPANLTLTINPAPQQVAITSTQLACTVGAACNAPIVVTGGVPPYTCTSTGLPPDGLKVGPACAVTGTPTATGAFTVTVVAKDSEGNASQPTAIHVTVNPQTTPVTITSPLTLPNGKVGTAYGPACPTIGCKVGVQFAASGGIPGYTYAVVSGSVPGVTMSTAGFYSGKPSKGGTFNILVQASDSQGNKSATIPYQVQITGSSIFSKIKSLL